MNLGLIWNYQSSEVISLGEDPNAEITDNLNALNVFKPGYKRHEFVYYKTLGAKFDPVTHEYNGDIILSDEKVDYGNPYPDHTGSFTINFRFLKNFTFYSLAEWGLNNKIYSQTQYFMVNFGNWVEANNLEDLLASQTPGTQEYINTANKLANLSVVNDGNFIHDAQYFVIREVSLSYDFTELLRDFELSSIVKTLQLGISGRNVFRTSAYKLSDFEINSQGSRTLSRGVDFLTLQQPRVFNFWLNIGF